MSTELPRVSSWLVEGRARIQWVVSLETNTSYSLVFRDTHVDFSVFRLGAHVVGAKTNCWCVCVVFWCYETCVTRRCPSLTRSHECVWIQTCHLGVAKLIWSLSPNYCRTLKLYSRCFQVTTIFPQSLLRGICLQPAWCRRVMTISSPSVGTFHCVAI